MNKILLVLLLLSPLFQSCTPRQNISESEFDAQSWKDDKNGCQNKRQNLLADFKNIASKLQGLSEPELRSLLGSPDTIELYKRHQKFYIYFIDAAQKCKNNTNSKPQKVFVRFNAINNVNEITYKQ